MPTYLVTYSLDSESVPSGVYEKINAAMKEVGDVVEDSRIPKNALVVYLDSREVTGSNEGDSSGQRKFYRAIESTLKEAAHKEGERLNKLVVSFMSQYPVGVESPMSYFMS